MQLEGMHYGHCTPSVKSIGVQSDSVWALDEIAERIAWHIQAIPGRAPMNMMELASRWDQAPTSSS